MKGISSSYSFGTRPVSSQEAFFYGIDEKMDESFLILKPDGLQSTDNFGPQDFARIALEEFSIKECPPSQVELPSKEVKEACASLLEALKLREKYQIEIDSVENNLDESFDPFNLNGPFPPNTEFSLQIRDGIIHVLNEKKESMFQTISFDEFAEDFLKLEKITSFGPCKSFTYKRLKALEYKFELHTLLNGYREQYACKKHPKDFSSVIKVDNHIHLAAAMTAQHLLQFITRKLKEDSKDVISEDGMTLEELSQQLHLSYETVTINSLDVQADNTFQRFDKFNTKYNPFGSSALRKVFLKTDNYVKGKYFAELTKELFDNLEEEQTIKTEYRVSIYGRSKAEWEELADWVFDNQVYSPDNRWIVQLPRIYDVFKKTSQVQSFEEMLSNIFEPLFEVTNKPESNPKLHLFLQQMSGFDSVDDESKLESKLKGKMLPPSPSHWDTTENPPYYYYIFYTWANLRVLNQFRRSKNLNLFSLRPHCGEAGDIDHLVASFMMATNINHGINLQKNTPLQYLFYLSQVGLSISPLSNDGLFLDYKRNPFSVFFKRGLNVSLSSDDPLIFHKTQYPLREEFSNAAKRFRLSDCDLSEIARNSVLQSGFPHNLKKKWLGENYWKQGVESNDVNYTNLPEIRMIYRHETLEEEIRLVQRAASLNVPDLFKAIKVNIKPMGDVIVTKEHVQAATNLHKALKLRKKYFVDYRSSVDPAVIDNCTYFEKDGVFQLVPPEKRCSYDEESLATMFCSDCCKYYCEICGKVIHKKPNFRTHCTYPIKVDSLFSHVHTFKEFVRDFNVVDGIRQDGPTQTFSFQRLSILAMKYRLWEIMNEEIEKEVAKRLNVDFQKAIKVDTHVHLASVPTAEQLLHFMKKKFKYCSHDIVLKKEGQDITLGDVFDSLGITQENLTLDSLDVKAIGTFGRFDKYKCKYNPLGNTAMRYIFLKRENEKKGQYLAELLKDILEQRQRKSPFTLSEYRISIYGRKKTEWNFTAEWMLNNKMNYPNNRWVIQVPRIYHILKSNGEVESFQDMLSNLFEPLFEVTKDPSSNPALHEALQHISGFDSVDDEGNELKESISESMPTPMEWTYAQNPPYSYYLYYMWANIQNLNQYRHAKGLNTFELRPHSGASGPRSHLTSAFLLASKITHGLNLKRAPTLQYLYYLCQIGISLSPISEDAVFTKYKHNPLGDFFTQGLNVCLSSDNPLQLHSTNDPLMEEYSVASKMWKFNDRDLCELARNSVLQSGFPLEKKKEWIGRYTANEPLDENEEHKTGVSSLRIQFRIDSLENEKSFIKQIVKAHNISHRGDSCLPALENEEDSCEPGEKKESNSSEWNINPLGVFLAGIFFLFLSSRHHP